MFLNIMIIMLIIGVLGAAYYLYYINRKKSISDYLKEAAQREKDLTEYALLLHIQDEIYKYTRESMLDKGYNAEEYQNQKKIRNKLKYALKQCKYGSLQDKEIVKDYIYNSLREYIGKEIDDVIKFKQSAVLTMQDKFEILLYIYKEIKGFKYEALERLIRAYDLDREKKIIENKETISYIVTDEEIDEIFFMEYEQVELTYRDKLNIITQRIYQQFKGLGVIDEIRDMKIDGVSGGVSGEIDSTGLEQSIEEFISKTKGQNKFYDSVWIFFAGKSIHLSFLTFGSEEELIRVCQNIYSYNKVGQLHERAGFKINEMKDGSRVVCLRPPFAESWAFFVRKFNLKDAKLRDIVKGENSHNIISLLEYLVKGARICALTGSQGTGKTTLLMALIKAIYATFTLRIQETAFELHLRNIYPNRNILSLRETDTIAGQDGLDVQKKTDGAVNILGEVATDPVAAWMVQMAQVASLFTLFTHHAKTAVDLILSLRNSLLKCDIFRDENVAEKQVAQVLNFDIHLVKTADGKRFIERITEIESLKEEDYPMDFNSANTEKEAMIAFYKTATEFFKRSTDRKNYKIKNIVEYHDGRYVFVNEISDDNLRDMRANMTEEDKKGFDLFLNTAWEG